MRTVISLGYNCQPEFVLQRNFSQTLNSIVGNFITYKLKNLDNLMQNNFEDFFEDFQTTGVYSNHFHKVCDTKNEIVSIHNCPLSEPIEKSIASMKKQCQELLSNIKEADDILFVRRNKGYEEKQTTIDFRNTLNILRNGKPFKLFIFQNKSWMKENWNVPNLYTFYDEDWIFENTWVGNYERWEKAFSTL